jgi:polysaccharide chain length determinant protein (PEP-CTERM system associated)
MNIDGGLQISDLGGVLRRRAKAVAATSLAVTLVIYWIAMALPNVYTSYATVLVEPQAVSGDLVKAGVADSDINQRLHLMTAQILARPRMSRIIDELGLYKKESEYLLREELIDLMRKDVRVEPVVPELEQRSGRTRDIAINEFRILYDSYDANVARDVAQRLANDFIETHINARVQQSQKSLEFVEGELERLSKRVREVETQIAQVKADNSGTLPEELDSNQRRLDRVLQDLASAQRTYDEANSDKQFFESQLATAKAMGGASTDDASPARRLELLKLELSESLARGFTAKHPDVIRAREEIALLEKKVKADKAEEEADSLNPMVAQTSAQARRAGLRAAAAQSDIERLSQLAEELQTQLNATPAVAKQLDALKIEYEHLFNTFQDFAKRHNEATVQAQLERRQLGEQFRVLEAAFRAPEPSAPNRGLILILGAVFAMMIGMGVGILLEALDTSPHDARALQNRLALPVLASIPAIWLESDRLYQRRARTRTALATVAVVMFALVGGAANYMWVNGAPRFLQSRAEEEKTEEAAPGTTAGESAAAKPASPKPVAAPAPAAPAAPPKG